MNYLAVLNLFLSKTFVSSFVLLCFAGTSFAQLVFTIDIDANTITADGSCTVTFGSGSDLLQFKTPGSSSVGANSPWSFNTSGLFSGSDFWAHSLTVRQDNIILELGHNVGGTTTITGSGNPISYASLSAVNQTILEAQIGSQFTAIEGSFVDGAPTFGSAIPEPSTYAAVLGLIGLIGCICMRKNRKKITH